MLQMKGFGLFGVRLVRLYFGRGGRGRLGGGPGQGGSCEGRWAGMLMVVREPEYLEDRFLFVDFEVAEVSWADSDIIYAKTGR